MASVRATVLVARPDVARTAQFLVPVVASPIACALVAGEFAVAVLTFLRTFRALSFKTTVSTPLVIHYFTTGQFLRRTARCMSFRAPCHVPLSAHFTIHLISVFLLIRPLIKAVVIVHGAARVVNGYTMLSTECFDSSACAILACFAARPQTALRIFRRRHAAICRALRATAPRSRRAR